MSTGENRSHTQTNYETFSKKKTNNNKYQNQSQNLEHAIVTFFSCAIVFRSKLWAFNRVVNISLWIKLLFLHRIDCTIMIIVTRVSKPSVNKNLIGGLPLESPNTMKLIVVDCWRAHVQFSLKLHNIETIYPKWILSPIIIMIIIIIITIERKRKTKMSSSCAIVCNFVWYTTHFYECFKCENVLIPDKIVCFFYLAGNDHGKGKIEMNHDIH